MNPSNNVKIEFTPEEYKSLLKLLYLGEWMHNAYNESEPSDVEKVVQKVFAKSKEAGLERMIQYTEDLGKYFPTRNMEEIFHLLVEDYDESTFYEELPYRLAERDFEAKYTKSAIKKMSAETQFLKKEELAEKYFDEFEKNGLKNLRIR